MIWRTVAVMVSVSLAAGSAVAQTIPPAAPAPSAQPAAKPAPAPTPPLAQSQIVPIATLAQRFASAEKIRGIAKIGNQQVAYRLPRGSRPIAEVNADATYAVVLAANPEQMTNWTTQIAVVGYRDLARVDGMTDEVMAGLISNPDNSECAAQFVSLSLGRFEVDGWPATAVVTGCADAPASQAQATPRVGIQVVGLVVRGLDDLFVVQVTFRGQPFAPATPPLTQALAQQVLNQLAPIAMCAISLTNQQCLEQQARARLVEAKPVVLDPLP
jgi:hypothetical protein